MLPLRLFLTAAAVAAATLTATAVPSFAASARSQSQGCGVWQSPTAELACGKAKAREVRRTLASLRRGESVPATLAAPSDAESAISRTSAALWSLHKAYQAVVQATDRMMLLPWTSDWQTAVRIVQASWPGSSGWLLACSSSEGGWGPWIPNSQGSGAGGWMQYMVGTFYGDYDSALAHAQGAGLPRPPAAARSWYSALGQAFAAGWAFFFDRPAGKWTGARC